MLFLSLLSSILIPLLFLASIQYVVVPWVSQQDDLAKQEREAGKHIKDIILFWDATEITTEQGLKDITETIEHRMLPSRKCAKGILDIKASSTTAIPSHSNHQLASHQDLAQISHPPLLPVQSVTQAMSKNDQGPATIISLTPQSKILDKSPEIESILRALMPAEIKNLGNGHLANKVSVRSLHPGQERLATTGYPPAPIGYTQRPWKDGFVYVSDNKHIDENDISHARRYGENAILVTLLPDGQNRMFAMARSLSQMKVSVAVILNGTVRGIYDPLPSLTDQFMIESIPATPNAIDCIADSLSRPNQKGPQYTTLLEYSYPKPNTSYLQQIAHQYLPITLNISLCVFVGMIFINVLIISLVHLKTRN
ncbi:MAG: hypothetical protein RRY13_08070 [Akkermansia sp.]